ncbi:hypothetical protein BMETH_1656_1 [methanotrophic bacterial endosymbiont of Bathymodiolus sp.]|nr:hypothetical protein BMETH_1656_1 [methanotrophic bacterial endosymbiont of Bathymodiolus sp.]
MCSSFNLLIAFGFFFANIEQTNLRVTNILQCLNDFSAHHRKLKQAFSRAIDICA